MGFLAAPRSTWIAVGALLPVAVYSTVLVVRAPAITGVWEDDGAYLVTSRSLAQGNGYRRLDLPGEPLQTKYPILYPLVLSGIWRLWPDFPRNIAAMQGLNATFGFGAALLAFLLTRRAWRLPIWLCAAGTVAATAASFWVQMIQYTMSELPYAALSTGALLCAVHAMNTGMTGGRRAHILAALLSGALAAGAYLTRSIGVTLVVAVIASWLLRRRWREACLSAILPAIAILGWNAWCALAQELNRSIPQAKALAFDLDYGAWILDSPAELARVAWLNSTAIAWAAMQSILDPSPAWIDRAARADPGRGDLPYVATAFPAALAFLFLVGRGLWITAGKAALPVHLYLLLYLCAVLAWPFRPDRFLVPLLPLISTALLAGLWATARGLMRLFTAAPDVLEGPAPNESRSADQFADDAAAVTHQRPAIGPISGPREVIGGPARVTLAAALILILHLLHTDYRSLMAPQAEQMHRQRGAAVEMIKSRTSPQAVLAGVSRGFLFLSTGRRFVPVLPYDDAAALYYPADRTFLAGGRIPTRGEAEAHDEVAQQRLEEYYSTTGANYVLMADDGGLESRIVARYLMIRPDRYPVYADAGPWRLWRVVSGARQQPELRREAASADRGRR